MDNLDLPGLIPNIKLPLESVGTSSRFIPFRIKELASAQAPYQLCSVELYASLPMGRRGIHISRFSEVLQRASETEYSSFQALTGTLAREIALSQEVESSFVKVSADWIRLDAAPVSGQSTQKAYKILGEASYKEQESNIRLGLIVPTILTCPCVQINLKAKLEDDSKKLGFSSESYHSLLSVFPIASHSQRGQVEIRIEDNEQQLLVSELIGAIESQISVTHDLLKRPDEVEVVYRSHLRPRFCEDVVRDVAVAIFERYSKSVPRETRLWIHVTSQESIHSYDIVSDLNLSFGEISDLLS